MNPPGLSLAVAETQTLGSALTPTPVIPAPPASLGHAYPTPPGADGATFLAGASRFRVSEMEVFALYDGREAVKAKEDVVGEMVGEAGEGEWEEEY